MESLKEYDEKIKSIKSSLSSAHFEATSLENMEEKIFLPVVPVCRNICLEVFRKIEDLLKSDIKPLEINNSIESLLKINLELFHCMKNLLTKVTEINKLKKVDHVYSILVNIAVILFETFKHCQISQSIYGNLFIAMSSLLMSVFRVAHEVQVNYLSFLNESITFNCTLQNELDILVEVMEIMARSGELLISLDIKTLTVLWKGYVLLMKNYIKDLKMWLDVSQPISFLVKDTRIRLHNISSVVAAGNNEPDESRFKQFLKDLKVGSFILKIIIKICELYLDNLVNSHKELLSLLVTLKGFSSCFIHNYKLPAEILDYIDRNISIAAGPLLAQLCQDNVFVNTFYESFANYCDSFDDDNSKEKSFIKIGEKIGFLLLVVDIQKKLINSDQTVQHLWLKNETSLIKVILNAVQHCGVEMNIDVIINRSEMSGFSDLYETVVTHTAAYVICTTTEKSFAEIENLLLSKILQPHFWTALLASDLFCVLARFGNNDLRLAQVQYLVHLIVNWPANKQVCPEWVYLIRLVARLMKMLPTYQYQSVLSQYPALFTAENGFIGVFNDFNLQIVCDSINRFFSFNTSDNRIIFYDDMVRKLEKVPFMNLAGSEVNFNFNLCLIKLWRCCAGVIDSGNNAEWLNKLIYVLHTVTGAVLPYVNVDLLHEVLDYMLIILKNCSVYCKLSLLKFLKLLPRKELRMSDKLAAVFKQIARLFEKLINDPDVFVNLSALETFKCFAQVTQHPQIIIFTAQINHNVEQLVKNYLQGTFMDNETAKLSYEEFLEILEKLIFVHKCGNFKSSDNSLPSINKMESESTLPLNVTDGSFSALKTGCENHITKGSVDNQFVGNNIDEKILSVLKEINVSVNEILTKCKDTPDNFTCNSLLNELQKCLTNINNSYRC